MNSSDIGQSISTTAQRLQNKLHIFLTLCAIIKRPECTNSFNQLRACSLDACLGISMEMILDQRKSNVCFCFLNFSEDVQLCLKCGQRTQLVDDWGKSLCTLHFHLWSITVTSWLALVCLPYNFCALTLAWQRIQHVMFCFSPAGVFFHRTIPSLVRSFTQI